MRIDTKDFQNPFVWTLLGSGDDFESMLYIKPLEIAAVTVERDHPHNRGALVIYMKSGHVFRARNVDSYSTAELRSEFNIPEPVPNTTYETGTPAPDADNDEVPL